MLVQEVSRVKGQLQAKDKECQDLANLLKDKNKQIERLKADLANAMREIERLLEQLRRL